VSFRDAVRLAFQTIRAQKLKSGFSIIGVFIGVQLGNGAAGMLAGGLLALLMSKVTPIPANVLLWSRSWPHSSPPHSRGSVSACIPPAARPGSLPSKL
jgi:hypothetical protein